MSGAISAEAHRRQIEAYVLVEPLYRAFAAALKRVFEQVCDDAIPERIVQARAKSVSGFAEKCARKFDKYPDAVNQLTDLCGVRVIVQTLDQVDAVDLFLQHNFELLEQEDKSVLLGDDKFGYRDRHYLIRIRPERALRIGLAEEEAAQFAGRIAELQVRSFTQHAWADTLHDRTYKNPLKLSPAQRRSASLLAATMEEGDRNFNRLASEIDVMLSDYSAYAPREHVEREARIQELIFQNEADPSQRARLAVRLARLLVPCGEYEKVVELLRPLADMAGPHRNELLLELGYALCRLHRTAPGSTDYSQGQTLLAEVLADCERADFTAVPNLKRRRTLHARALSRLAWSWEASVPGSEGKALELHRRAVLVEPENPYLLADQLGFEIYCSRNSSLVEAIRPLLAAAINTCRAHALAGAELPHAYFTAARLHLLVGDAAEALGWCARGLRHFFERRSCVAESLIEDQFEWLRRFQFGALEPPESHSSMEEFIRLACAFQRKRCQTFPGKPRRVLIVTGGTSALEAIGPMLREALQAFRGIVLSSGSDAGIAECLGHISAELQARGRKYFDLVGYVSEGRPRNASTLRGFDRFVSIKHRREFSPSQILAVWEDLYRHEIDPENVSLIGFGGGTITAAEYRLGFAMGAAVGVVSGTGGAGDALLRDPIWNVPSILAIPCDPASIRAFVVAPDERDRGEQIETMARSFHALYLRESAHRLPPNLRSWDLLAPTYRRSNIAQAEYALEILHAAGFEVEAGDSVADAVHAFTPQEVEMMAELEHGRWNIDRLRDGWRPARTRDNENKLHDCITSWCELPEKMREYDRVAVRAFPEVLGRAGLKIVRRKK